MPTASAAQRQTAAARGPYDPTGGGPNTLTSSERNYLLSVGALGKLGDRETIDVGKLLSLGRNDFYNGLVSRGVLGQPNAAGRGGNLTDTRPLPINFPARQSGSLLGRLASVFGPPLSILGGVAGLGAALSGFPSLGIGGLGDILGKSAAPAIKGIPAAAGAIGGAAGASLPSAGGLGAALAARAGGTSLPAAGISGVVRPTTFAGPASPSSALNAALSTPPSPSGVTGRATKIAENSGSGLSLLDVINGAGTVLSGVGALTSLGGGGGASLPTPNAPQSPAPAPTAIQRKFTQPTPLEAPSFLRLSSQMTPLQQRASIATNALYGSSLFRDPQAAKFHANLALRSLVGPNGELASFENVLPVEREFATQVLGSPLREDSTAGFLDALLRGTA